MTISVVIPTYNRPAELRACLASIMRQTVPVAEVLVVDNSDRGREAVRQVVEQMAGVLASAGMALRYVPNPGRNSLTTAKNLGIDLARGEIISFLDDDVVLDERYYEEILAVYRAHPHALGVEGAVTGATTVPGVRFALEQALGRLFFLGYREAAGCRVLPSFAVTYPLRDELIACEWLSGAASYRRRILDDIRPDERLRKYADNEDVDLSYAIFRKHPGTLFLTPRAKYRHDGSTQARVTGRERVYMQEVYRLYLVGKHIAATPANRLIYLWSRVGRLAYLLGRAVVRRSWTDVQEAWYLLGAWTLCIRHAGEIRSGDLGWFDQWLS